MNEIEFERRLDEDGIAFIKKHEGFRKKAYLDSAGILTIGFGSIRIFGRAVRKDDEITEHQALSQMALDLETFEHAVNEHVYVYLTQKQYTALVSFTYNIGQNAFRNSTLLKKLNQSDYNAAADELLRWVNAGGNRIQGLVNRRTDERALFLEDVKQ